MAIIHLIVKVRKYSSGQIFYNNIFNNTKNLYLSTSLSFYYTKQNNFFLCNKIDFILFRLNPNKILLTIINSMYNNEIDYELFKSKSTILVSKQSSNFNHAMRFFKRNNPICDGIMYRQSVRFPSFYDTLHVDNNGLYYYEHKPNVEIDVIDNVFITPNTYVKLSFYIGDICYEQHEFTEYINAISETIDFRIRLTFAKIPTINGISTIDNCYTIRYNAYILKDTIIQELKTKKVVTTSSVYNNGTCCKIKKQPEYKHSNNIGIHVDWFELRSDDP